MTRAKKRLKKVAAFINSIDMSRVPKECTAQVIYSVLTPNSERRLRLTVYKFLDGERCAPSCDGEEPLKEPWNCRRLVMCCENNYMVVREWIATR